LQRENTQRAQKAAARYRAEVIAKKVAMKALKERLLKPRQLTQARQMVLAEKMKEQLLRITANYGSRIRTNWQNGSRYVERGYSWS
jgi:hypothetical protein